MRIQIKFLLLLMLPLAVNAQTVTDQFLGTWQVDITRTIESMDRDSKQRYDSLGEETKTRATASMADRIFHFKDKEEVLIDWVKSQEKVITNGRWVIEESNSSIAITAGGKTVVYNYSFISSQAVLLKGTASQGLFNSLYLTKK